MALSKTMKTVLWIAIPVVVIGGGIAIHYFRKRGESSGESPKTTDENGLEINPEKATEGRGGSASGKFVRSTSSGHNKPVGHIGADLHKAENVNKTFVSPVQIKVGDTLIAKKQVNLYSNMAISPQGYFDANGNQIHFNSGERVGTVVSIGTGYKIKNSSNDKLSANIFYVKKIPVNFTVEK